MDNGGTTKMEYYLEDSESVTWNGVGRFFDYKCGLEHKSYAGVNLLIQAFGVKSVTVHCSRPGVMICQTRNYFVGDPSTEHITTDFQETVVFDNYEDYRWDGVQIIGPINDVGERIVSMYSITITYDRALCLENYY